MGIRFTFVAATGIAAFVLAGCSPFPVYKDVMQDKDAFLQAHYTPDQLRANVVARIKSADNSAPRFGKSVLTIVPHVVNGTGETDKIAKENVTKYTATGGALFMGIEEDKSNDVTGTTTFTTSYRGIVTLKSQWFAPGNALGTMVWEVKEFKEFPDASALRPNSQIVYRYTSGTGPQAYNFKESVLTCKSGDEFPASTINPKIDGNAMKLSCQLTDEVGAVTSNYENVYLMKYGIAVPIKRLGSTFTTDFEIKDLQFY